MNENTEKVYLLAFKEEALQMLVDIVNEYASIIVIDKLPLKYTFKQVKELQDNLLDIVYNTEE